MKKLLAVVILAVGATSFAQEKMGKRNGDITPQERKEIQEKRTELQATRMKAELDLTDDQVVKLKDVFAKQQQKRTEMQQKMMELRKSGQKPTEEQRLNMKNERDAERENFEKDLKSILTPDQFTKWQKNNEDRKNKMRRGDAELREAPVERRN